LFDFFIFLGFLVFLVFFLLVLILNIFKTFGGLFPPILVGSFLLISTISSSVSSFVSSFVSMSSGYRVLKSPPSLFGSALKLSTPRRNLTLF